MGGIRREYTLPAIKYDNEIMITNKGKVEALAKTFVKVHSSANLTPDARKGRDEVMREHSNILMEKDDFNGTLNVSFSLFLAKKSVGRSQSNVPW